MQSVRYGDRGSTVQIMQALLRAGMFLGADGEPLNVDGIYGKNTRAAVMEFKKKASAYGLFITVNNDVFDKSCWQAILMED